MCRLAPTMGGVMVEARSRVGTPARDLSARMAWRRAREKKGGRRKVVDILAARRW